MFKNKKTRFLLVIVFLIVAIGTCLFVYGYLTGKITGFAYPVPALGKIVVRVNNTNNQNLIGAEVTVENISAFPQKRVGITGSDGRVTITVTAPNPAYRYKITASKGCHYPQEKEEILTGVKANTTTYGPTITLKEYPWLRGNVIFDKGGTPSVGSVAARNMTINLSKYNPATNTYASYKSAQTDASGNYRMACLSPDASTKYKLGNPYSSLLNHTYTNATYDRNPFTIPWPGANKNFNIPWPTSNSVPPIEWVDDPNTQLGS